VWPARYFRDREAVHDPRSAGEEPEEVGADRDLVDRRPDRLAGVGRLEPAQLVARRVERAGDPQEMRLRSWGVVFLHVWNAVSAALTARSTSSADDAGTLAMTWPFAGFSMSSVSPRRRVDELAADELLVGLDSV
jgi:hypothetical protein